MSSVSAIQRIAEPGLEFRYGQAVADPHDGLSLFGPQDTDTPSHPKSITYGVIGTREGIESFSAFSQLLAKPNFLKPEPENPRLWPIFPGFEAAFHCIWPGKPAAAAEIEREELLNRAKQKDASKRVYDVVNTYLDAARKLSKRDEAFDLFVCVVPDQVWLNCRPESRVAGGVGAAISRNERLLRAAGQTSLFDDYEPEQYRLSTDFRRQIKARAMEYRVPIQIIRESTLYIGDQKEFGSRGLTPMPDRAWNLSTALYYKAGGKPWRLSTAREGVSYVGIAFRKTAPHLSKSRTAVCAAQMFIDTGDGIVFLGESGPWFSPKDRQFHLSGKAAKDLITGVLTTYRELDGRPLKEVFLHSRSEISDDEYAGYLSACPDGTKVVGIRVRTDRNGLRMFREGSRPVLRGTFLRLNERTGFLWATGFKPELRTYDGWEVPAPLRIDIQHGDADIYQVACDILGLTKLNYNACKLGASQPVTIGFSDAVGEILVSNPDIKHCHPQFKFYI